MILPIENFAHVAKVKLKEILAEHIMCKRVSLLFFYETLREIECCTTQSRGFSVGGSIFKA